MQLGSGKRLSACILALLFTVLSFTAGEAQEAINLTILVPTWTQDVYNEDLFNEFESLHPGMSVMLARDPGLPGISSAVYDLDAHLDTVEQYTQAADVVFISSDQWDISPEATRAGYFLDLTPLVASDTTLNAEDFFEPIWQSYQWGGGIWALPTSAGVVLLTYDVTTFDEAGLAYPNESWTLDDLISAARALARNDDQTIPGLITLDNLPLLLYSLTRHMLYDWADPSLAPHFVTPELDTAIAAWEELEAEGSAVQFANDVYNETPIRIEETFRLYSPSITGHETAAAALLPGGTAGLNVRGFAVSAGTQHPELAYELAKYMTFRQEATSLYPFNTHARQSLSDGFASYPAEFQPLLQNALANAVPLSSLLYGDYVAYGIRMMAQTGGDALVTLQEAEARAVTALQAAAERGNTNTLSVATAVPQPNLAAGEVTLDFGLNTPIAPLVNQNDWDRLIADFVVRDPQVAQIDLQLQVGPPQAFNDVDCFYYPQNQVPELDLATILNLDPLLAADPSFDPNVLIGGTLAALQRENRIWAYPLVIEPAVLWYNTQLFAQAGLDSPEGGWAVEEFDDALQQLRALSGDSSAVFVPPFTGNTYLLMLIAAYGGLPVDYRTSPPTVQLNDSAVIDATRQVLELAKAGVIDYRPLDVMGGGGGFSGPGEAPIYGDRLDMLSFRMLLRSDPNYPAALQQLAPYPHGSQAIPVSYSIGAAYISASTPNPEACYRWISFLAEHPTLFASMPAQQILIDDPALAAAQGEDAVAFYHLFAGLLQEPNVIVFPELSGGTAQTAGWIEQMWLNRAFDNTVLNDADLETELAQAQTFITDFRACTADLPAFDAEAGMTMDAYSQQHVECAVSVDPQLGARFGLTN